MKNGLLLTTLFFAFFLTLTPAFAQEGQATKDPVGGTYTIRKGDTLWDISGARLSDPFAWPRIWKDNPFIHNPNLIFPGQVIKLPPGVTIAPPTAETPPPPAPEEKKPFVERGEMEQVQPPSPGEEIITIPPPVLRQPVASAIEILNAGFIDEHPEETRPIEGSPSPRDLYSLLDELYVKADGVRVGDRFIIGRYTDEVENPETGKPLGRVVRVTGILDIEGPMDGFMVGSITKAFTDVKSTDLLFPYQEPLLVYEPVQPNPKAEGLSGYVVAVKGERDDGTQTDIMYINRGALDGVLPGDSFVVARPGRVMEHGKCPLRKKETVLPETEVGRIQVISVRGRTAAAKVVSSDDPLQVGYRVYYSR